MKPRRHLSTPTQPWRLLSMALLLLVYVAGTMPVDSLHAWIHANETPVLHTAADEKDACHQTLFHHASKADKGCDHKTHVTKIKSCPLCHVVLHADQSLHEQATPAILHVVTVQGAKLTHTVVSLTPAHGSSRAPPVV